MTVQTNNNSISYVGNGSTVHFDYDYLILNASHLKVYFGDVLQTSGYAVSGVSSQTGGTVAFAVAPPNGTNITLIRDVPFLQLTDYQPYDAFPAESHERALDLLTMMTQQLKDELGRTMQHPVGGNKWDARGNEITNLGTGSSGTSAANINQVKYLIASEVGDDPSASASVRSREALRRNYAGAGYNLVDGSFEAGGTLVNANDVLLQERTGKAFTGPAGPVAAGTDPVLGGFVDLSHALDRVSSVDNFIQALTGATEYTGSIPSSNFYGEITQFTPYGNDNLKVYRTRDGYEWELDVIGIVGTAAVRLYVSSGATGGGTSIGSPMSFATLQANVTSGFYNNIGSLHIYLIDEFYGQDDAITDFGAITGTKVYLRSINRNGYSWLTGGRKYTYSKIDSYYSAVINSTPILYCFNTRELDGNGCPIVYKKVDDVAGLVPGSWCKVGSVLYVRPIRTGSDIDKTIVAVLQDSNKFQWSKNDGAVICENIRWATGNINCLSFAPQSLAAQAVFVRNTFLAGKNDGFGVEAPAYKIAMLDCISGYAGKDGFNYHATGLSALNGAIALEVNCKGYYAGLYKYEGGNATTNSNNASTAHDGMTVIRLGCNHYECEGPVIADVDGCYSINYDTDSNGVLDSTTGDKAAWLFFRATSPTFQLSRTVMVNCQGGKSDFDLLTGQGVDLIYDNLDVNEKKVSLFNGNLTLRITK